ncbi:MAG: hypothetical protein K8W52_45615 [Deltaproteobacteria bacterium]|nr:hypothetical protein [Deltaproteobacteria bacterium]
MRAALAYLAIFTAACHGGTASPDAATAAIDAMPDSPPPDGAPDAPSSPNVMFVTSTVHTANLGGLDGADAICSQRAAAAGLHGTFRAFLSSSTVNAIDRLENAPGWVRPDGKPFARSAADVAAGHILYPPRLDENGATVALGEQVRTGSNGDGSTAGPWCGDWVGDSPNGTCVGSHPESALRFANDSRGSLTCADQAHLYCFQVDSKTPAPAPHATGHIAFISRDTRSGASLENLDHACAVEAGNAGLPGTYVALLGWWQSPPVSRVALAGAAVVRPDGVEIAHTPSVFDGPALDAPIAVTADGKEYVNRAWVWTGGDASFATASPFDCNTWGTGTEQVTSGTYADISGSVVMADAAGPGTSFATQSCSAEMRFYCIQQ